MKRNVYVAGRMRGLPYYGFPDFDKARDRLAALGLTPLSPADMDRAAGFDPTNWCAEAQLAAIASDWNHVPDTFDLAAAIARDNAAIDDPGTVALYVIHEGISESAGGMAEIERGMKGGKVILYDTMSDEAILRALGIWEPAMPPSFENTSGYKAAMEMATMNEGDKPLFKCTVCGRIGEVGRCCGTETRKPLNEAARREKNMQVAEHQLRIALADAIAAAAEPSFRVPTLTDAVKTARTFFTDPATGGVKEEKLARFDLIPPDIEWELAEHYGKGAKKYASRNMEKGYPWSLSFAAARRHLNAFWRGEDYDGETKSLHLIAAAWHCFTMAWFLRHNAGTDDRPNTNKEKA